MALTLDNQGLIDLVYRITGCQTKKELVILGNFKVLWEPVDLEKSSLLIITVEGPIMHFFRVSGKI